MKRIAGLALITLTTGAAIGLAVSPAAAWVGNDGFQEIEQLIAEPIGHVGYDGHWQDQVEAAESEEVLPAEEAAGTDAVEGTATAEESETEGANAESAHPVETTEAEGTETVEGAETTEAEGTHPVETTDTEGAETAEEAEETEAEETEAVEAEETEGAETETAPNGY